jgi:hypothetical protein
VFDIETPRGKFNAHDKNWGPVYGGTVQSFAGA